MSDGSANPKLPHVVALHESWSRSMGGVSLCYSIARVCDNFTTDQAANCMQALALLKRRNPASVRNPEEFATCCAELLRVLESKLITERSLLHLTPQNVTSLLEAIPVLYSTRADLQKNVQDFAVWMLPVATNQGKNLPPTKEIDRLVRAFLGPVRAALRDEQGKEREEAGKHDAVLQTWVRHRLGKELASLILGKLATNKILEKRLLRGTRGSFGRAGGLLPTKGGEHNVPRPLSEEVDEHCSSTSSEQRGSSGRDSSSELLGTRATSSALSRGRKCAGFLQHLRPAPAPRPSGATNLGKKSRRKNQLDAVSSRRLVKRQTTLTRLQRECALLARLLIELVETFEGRAKIKFKRAMKGSCILSEETGVHDFEAPSEGASKSWTPVSSERLLAHWLYGRTLLCDRGTSNGRIKK